LLPEYTLFYCDPPFLPIGVKDRDDYYRFAFTEKDMRDLLDLLDRIKGYFILKLPGDHLEVDFIKEWASREGRQVFTYTKSRSQHKSVGSKKPKWTVVLVTNY
jgi:site-specific DNA-adenine methylase